MRKIIIFFPKNFGHVIEGGKCPFCEQGVILKIPIKTPFAFVITCSNGNCIYGFVPIPPIKMSLCCVEFFLMFPDKK